MEEKTDLQKLMDILDHQPCGVEKDGWASTKGYVIQPGLNTSKDLLVREEHVGFNFDENGRFVGIFNWKE